MYTATFTFAKGAYDDEFHALDRQIAEIAKAIPGYLGEEAWENAETGGDGGIAHPLKGRSPGRVGRLPPGAPLPAGSDE